MIDSLDAGTLYRSLTRPHASVVVPVFGLKKTFITDICANDNECASGCCGFKSGKCAGPIIAQTRDGGCGHGDAQPNSRAADALRGNLGRGSGAANTGGAASTLVVAQAKQTPPAMSSCTYN